MDEYIEKTNLTEQYLDKIDIEYISKAFHITDVYDLMRKIEDDIITGEIEGLDGGIFNYMNSDEFIDYLRRRYGTYVCTEYIRYELNFKK